MTEDRLTVHDIETAMNSIRNAPSQPTVYLAHPQEKAHLDKHDGGRLDCAECVRIWQRITARSL